MKRILLYTALVLVCGAGLVCAQLPVFDASVFAQALLEVSKLTAQYNELVETYQMITNQYNQMLWMAKQVPVNMAARYHAIATPWQTSSATNIYGTTGNWITVTSFHAALFERLQRSFNNPNLLKEVGVVYLEEFRMPAIALKHFELARQFAPKDRDIEQLQVAAALAVARQMTDQSAHSGLDEAAPSKPAVNALLRKTSKLAHVVDTRTHLDETADEMMADGGHSGGMAAGFR